MRFSQIHVLLAATGTPSLKPEIPCRERQCYHIGHIEIMEEKEWNADLTDWADING